MKISELKDKLVFIEGIEDLVGYLRHYEEVDKSELYENSDYVVVLELIEEEDRYVVVPCNLEEIHLYIIN